MKALYLVRHAKSSWQFPELADHDRPLNKRGLRDAPMIGKRLAARGITPDVLVSSTALRAMTTAKLLAKEIQYPEKRIITESRLFDAGADTIITLIRALQESFGSAMLVAHNPGMTDAVNRLGYLHLQNMPTCGIMAMNFAVAKWRDISADGAVEFYDFPKNRSSWPAIS